MTTLTFLLAWMIPQTPRLILGPYGEVVYHLFLAFTLSLFIYITFLQIVIQSLIWLAPLHYNALALAILNPVGTLRLFDDY